MAQFLSIEEAAKQLGISKEELNEMRDRGEVRAFRDGASWKFKQDEIERVADQMQVGGGDDDFVDFGDDAGGDSGTESILLSEHEMGESGGAPSSTIIGRSGEPGGPDSDVKLADAEDEQSAAESPAEESSATDSELDISLGSNVNLDSNSGGATASGGGSQFDDLEELDVDLEGESASGETAAGGDEDEIHLASDTSFSSEAESGGDDIPLASDLTLESSAGGSDSSLAGGTSSESLASDDAAKELSLEDASELTLDSSEDDLGGSEVSLGGDSPSGSLSDLTGSDSGGSALELAADQDDELVLGEGSDSDITLSSGDSGIGLASPSDSGISLDEEEPMELGGSTVESLELGEDDEILLEEETDPDAATQLKADDDFMLTPLEDSGGEETEDSGSQVIALDSESFDESADTMLGGESAFPADDAAMADQLGDAGATLGAGGAGGFMPQEQYVPEASYSVWTVMSLILCFLFVALSGMMMFDLLRNMWSWNQPYEANSAIMDALVEMIPIFK